MSWAETVELLCERYNTTPWDVEANATTGTLRHIRLLSDTGEPVQERERRDPMEDMLANMSEVVKEPIG